MSEKETPQNEEVDLGQLFKLIGNMFSNFFNFIGSIFKGAFRFLIVVLLHFYKGLMWYVGAVILGVVGGYFLDKSSEDIYGAHLFIETNFDSSRQVYENIKNLNQLAEIDEDSEELAIILGISVKEAATIKGFYISPDIDENRIMQLFSDYKLGLDSISRLDAIYKDFKGELAFYNFDIHKIGVASTDKFIYRKLQNKLVGIISENQYIETLRESSLKNLEDEEKTLTKQSEELDELIQEYLKIRLSEAKKEPVPGAGTNLYLEGVTGENTLIVNEADLVDKKFELEIRKRAIQSELVKQQKVVNIIADFPKSGYDISEWTDKMKFVLPLILFGLTFIVSSFVLLMSYLKQQDELLSENK